MTNSNANANSTGTTSDQRVTTRSVMKVITAMLHQQLGSLVTIQLVIQTSHPLAEAPLHLPELYRF